MSHFLPAEKGPESAGMAWLSLMLASFNPFAVTTCLIRVTKPSISCGLSLLAMLLWPASPASIRSWSEIAALRQKDLTASRARS